MGLIARLFGRTAHVPVVPSSIPVVRRRSYAAATSSVRFSDFSTSNRSADSELEIAIATLRARARNLERNNPHFRRFLSLMQDNVVGSTGIRIQVRAKQPNGKTFDVFGNTAIETAWKQWSRRVTADGMMSMIEAQRMVVRTFARDGEVIVQLRKGKKYGKVPFALKFIEADLLDETLNRVYPNSGNRIRMGVELDEDERPVAYHMLTVHPGESTWGLPGGTRKYVRVPADEILHIFIKSRPGQTRGEPPAAAIMVDTKMLGGYREAELTNRRVAASKAGFFESEADSGPIKSIADQEDADGNLIMDVEPGRFTALPPGVTFKAFDPNASSTDYVGFEKQILRSIAAGLGPSYVDLAMDLEGVSFSSIRHGALSDREFYRGIQRFVIDRFMEPVYSKWLEMALDFGDLGLPASKFDKFFTATGFNPRGWEWVDPMKDVQASIAAWNGRLTSMTDIMAKRGDDFDEVMEQIAYEKQVMADHGIEPVQAGAVAAKDDTDEEDDPEKPVEKPKPKK